MKLLDRYVLKEMAAPFFVSLFAFVVLWVGRIIYDRMDMFVQMRPPVALVVRLIVYELPWVMKMSLPLAVLFSVCLGVTRLGRDSEITSIRMAGVPIRRILAPVLVLSLVASVVTLWLGESAMPWASREADRTTRFIQGSQVVPPIRENVFFRSEGYCFYVHRVERKSKDRVTLRDVMIYEMPSAGELPTLTTAKWATNVKNLWVLHDGIQHHIGKDGFVSYEMSFPEMRLDLNQAMGELWEAQRTADQMSYKELQDQVKVLGQVGQEATRLRVEGHFKLSIPFSCLVFALCAAPLSLRYSRVGSYSGLLLGVIVMFFYWQIILLGEALGMGGLVPPTLAGWSQNIVFAVIGVYLMWREE